MRLIIPLLLSILSQDKVIGGKPMFTTCIGTFGYIVGRKENDYVIWGLIYELCISYELYKGNVKFYEFISIYCVQ